MNNNGRKIPSNIENPFDTILISVCDKLIDFCNNLNSTPNSITIFRIILGIFIFQNWKKLKWFGSIWLLPFYIFLYASPFFSNSFANILHDRYILTGFGSLGVILVALYSKYFKNFLQNSIH